MSVTYGWMNEFEAALKERKAEMRTTRDRRIRKRLAIECKLLSIALRRLQAETTGYVELAERAQASVLDRWQEEETKALPPDRRDSFRAVYSAWRKSLKDLETNSGFEFGKINRLSQAVSCLEQALNTASDEAKSELAARIEIARAERIYYEQSVLVPYWDRYHEIHRAFWQDLEALRS